MQYMINGKNQPQAHHQVAYDIEAYTIAQNMRKKAEILNNPLLASVQGKNQTTLAFLSNAPRFGGNLADESEAFLGPGYYEQRSQFVDGERAKT